MVYKYILQNDFMKGLILICFSIIFLIFFSINQVFPLSTNADSTMRNLVKKVLNISIEAVEDQRESIKPEPISHTDIYNQEKDRVARKKTIQNTLAKIFNDVSKIPKKNNNKTVIYKGKFDICKPNEYDYIESEIIIKQYLEKIPGYSRNCNSVKIESKIPLGSKTKPFTEEIPTLKNKTRDLIDNFGFPSFFEGNENALDYSVYLIPSVDFRNDVFRIKYELSYSCMLSRTCSEHLYIKFDKTGRFQYFWETLQKIKWVYENSQRFEGTNTRKLILPEMFDVTWRFKLSQCLMKNRVDRSNCLNLYEETTKNCYFDALEETWVNLLDKCDFDLNFREKEKKINLKPLNEIDVLKLILDLKVVCSEVKTKMNSMYEIHPDYILNDLQWPYENYMELSRTKYEYMIMVHQQVSKMIYDFKSECSVPPIISSQLILQYIEEAKINPKSYKVKMYVKDFKDYLTRKKENFYKVSKEMTDAYENIFMTKTPEIELDSEKELTSYSQIKKIYLRNFIFNYNKKIAVDMYFSFSKLRRYYESSTKKSIIQTVRKNKSLYPYEKIVNVKDVFLNIFNNYKFDPEKSYILTEDHYRLCDFYLYNTIEKNSTEYVEKFYKIYKEFETLWDSYKDEGLLTTEKAEANRKLFCSKKLNMLDDNIDSEDEK